MGMKTPKRKSPFPVKKGPTNSGMFSHGTKGGKQKMDKVKDPEPACRAHAMSRVGRTNGH